MAGVSAVSVDFYATPGPFTALTDDQSAMVRDLVADPRALCRAVQGLVVSPPDATGAGLPDDRLAERNTRPAAALLRRVLELDADAPLDEPRPAERRVVGTCRHFAVLATAFLRATSVPARARCGFATYFVPPRKVDHWIVEHWSGDDRRGSASTPSTSTARLPAGPDARTSATASSSPPARRGSSSGRATLTRRTSVCSGPRTGDRARSAATPCATSPAWRTRWRCSRGTCGGRWRTPTTARPGMTFDVLIDQLATACRDPDGRDLQRIYEQLTVPDALIC